MIDAPTRHKFSVSSLLLMEQTGVFSSDQRVELVDGEVIDMSPIHPPHATCVRKLLRLFQQHLSLDDFMIDAQNPVQLSDSSLPQPDVIIASYRDELLRVGHWQAGDIRLLVEVSDSTYQYDRTKKYHAYAEAGIPEYWIANLRGQKMEVYTQPVGNIYQSSETHQTAFMTTLGFLLEVNKLLSRL